MNNSTNISAVFVVLTITLLFKGCHCSVSTNVPSQPGASSPVLQSNNTDNSTEPDHQGNTSTIAATTTTPKPKSTTIDYSYLKMCPDKTPCADLGASCISCKLNYYCLYGKVLTANCTVKPNITCIGSRTFQRPYECRYAYQLEADKSQCDMYKATLCKMKKAPPDTYYAQCRVKEEVLCLGNRTFSKKFKCSWTTGYKWSTALVLSITLGGFGVDRFYLGLWKEGIGKLFSFGGLGVWTIVDVILIAVGYVGPHDSSLYIYPWN